MSDFSAPKKHLVIGLGGTGGNIIRELRKAIASDRIPNPDVAFEFLYLDSDPTAMSPDSKGWRIAGKSVHLDDAQKMLIEGSSMGNMLSQLDSFPNIEPWLKPVSIFETLARSNVDSAQGGQRRKFGRFLLASRARAVMEKIADRMNVLQQQGNNDARITFHICCGLAGGTGSGTIVDIVAQLRTELNRQGRDARDYRILIYAMLPEMQPKAGKDSGNYHANGYAALAELNALNTGNLRPFDIVSTGKALDVPDPAFNGCYVFFDENENHRIVDVQDDLPGIVADFIYHKTLGTSWESLAKSENAENGDKHDEPAPDNEKSRQRSKRFLAFGIKRLVVPEDEIREFLTYNFARSAANQLVFNHWQDGLGFVAEARPMDLHSEVRKIENLTRWKLSDDHLTLSLGILPDDAGNNRWKRINEFWSAVVPAHKQNVLQEVAKKERWLDELKQRCEQIYDEGYRAAGGVKKFYETKLKAHRDMARHISRQLEQELFADWKTGTRSIAEIHQHLNVLIELLQEKTLTASERFAKCNEQAAEASAKVGNIVQEWSQLNWFKDALLGKGEKLFNAATEHLTAYYIYRTTAEGWAFAKKLVEELMAQLTELASEVDLLRATLQEATREFEQQAASRCKAQNDDAQYKQRVYNREVVNELNQRFAADDARQREHSQAIRSAIATRVGDSNPGFVEMARKIDRNELRDLLEEVSSQSVQSAHDTLESGHKRVLGVNIVQKLYEELGSDEQLNRFVRDAIAQSGVYMTFDPVEEQRNGPGIDREEKHKKIAGLFLPECKERPDFADKLADTFRANKTTAVLDVIREGVRPNEITLIRVDNLFPLRFLKPLSRLKERYDTRAATSEANRVLLHLQGEEQLSPLFVPSIRELAADRLPDMVLARALGLITERPNRSTGHMEAVLLYADEDGMEEEMLLGGRTFLEATEQIRHEALGLLGREVQSKLASLRHVDQRQALYQRVLDVVRAVGDHVGGDKQDPLYRRFNDTREPIKRRLELDRQPA